MLNLSCSVEMFPILFPNREWPTWAQSCFYHTEVAVVSSRLAWKKDNLTLLNFKTETRKLMPGLALSKNIHPCIRLSLSCTHPGSGHSGNRLSREFQISLSSATLSSSSLGIPTLPRADEIYKPSSEFCVYLTLFSQLDVSWKSLKEGVQAS